MLSQQTSFVHFEIMFTICNFLNRLIDRFWSVMIFVLIVYEFCTSEIEIIEWYFIFLEFNRIYLESFYQQIRKSFNQHWNNFDRLFFSVSIWLTISYSLAICFSLFLTISFTLSLSPSTFLNATPFPLFVCSLPFALRLLSLFYIFFLSL